MKRISLFEFLLTEASTLPVKLFPRSRRSAELTLTLGG